MNHLQIPVDSDDDTSRKEKLQVPLPADQPLPLCFGNSPIHAAILERNPDWKERCSQRMEELKSRQSPTHGESVRERKFIGYALYKAVASGNVDNFVEELQQECMQRKLSDIFDQVTGTGDSLLHVASETGREQIAELICDYFPELLFRRNIKGDTVLHAAVRSNNSKVVKLILSEYATAKSKHDEMKDKEITKETNEYGDTSLHEAVFHGNVDVVNELISADREVVNYLNKSKQSPLYLAAVEDSEEILNLLLEIPFPGEQLPLCLGNSPLHAAILKRNPALTRGILEKRPELVYLKDEDGNTSFHYSAYIGYVEGFDILLKHALNKLDEIALEGNNKGHLPIHLACKRGHIEVVKKFLQFEWPVDPLVLDRKGQNILHVAAKSGRINIVKYLLENPKINESTINWKDNDGNTPLHLASINLFPKVLYSFTQDARTKVNLLNNNGLTALDVALSSETVFFLRKRLVYQVLKAAGVSLMRDNMLHSHHHQRLPKKDVIKDVLKTFLVVATLMVTVTFAAAFTVPGGVYSSGDPNQGMAIFAHKPFFWVFTTFNMVAMYSSVIACGLMLMALIFDLKVAQGLITVAVLCLLLAFLLVPVAFMAAVRLVVANNSALATVITVIGAIYTSFILFSLLAVSLPFGTNNPLYRPIGRSLLWAWVKLINYDFKEGSNKDNEEAIKDKNKDNKSDEHV